MRGESDEPSILVWAEQGGAVQINQLGSGTPPNTTYVDTKIGAGAWYVTTMLDGRQISSMHKVVSADGRRCSRRCG